MKQVSIAAAAIVVAFAGGARAGAPTEDPIKGGQTFSTARNGGSAQGEDPIKGGQTIMSAAGNDMGASLPSRPNFSSSPAWRAYAYERGGIRYVQINDTDGVLRLVIGIAGTTPIVLPMGVDADRVAFGAPVGGNAVYRDRSIIIEFAGGTWFVQAATN